MCYRDIGIDKMVEEEVNNKERYAEIKKDNFK